MYRCCSGQECTGMSLRNLQMHSIYVCNPYTYTLLYVYIVSETIAVLIIWYQILKSYVDFVQLLSFPPLPPPLLPPSSPPPPSSFCLWDQATSSLSCLFLATQRANRYNSHIIKVGKTRAFHNSLHNIRGRTTFIYCSWVYLLNALIQCCSKYI